MKIQQSTDGGLTWVDSTLVTVFDGPGYDPDYSNPVLTETSTAARISELTTGTTYHFKLVVTGGSKAGDSNTITTIY